MTRLIRIVGAVLLSTTLLSCEKVIEIKLTDSQPKYVVEGVITNEAGSCKVLISRSNNFSDGAYENVSGAKVEIENNGVVSLLKETSAGVYQDINLTGKPGDTYNLKISVNGATFSAKCSMPQQVAFDKLYLTVDDFDKVTRYATVNYKDPKKQKNFYRFVQYKNSKKEKTLFVENDEFTNGEDINTQLDYSENINEFNTALAKGDKVEVEMQCIDASVYKYWFSIIDGGANGNSENAAPSNPQSNVTGGALGYFSAHTVQRKSMIVP